MLKKIFCAEIHFVFCNLFKCFEGKAPLTGLNKVLELKWF